MKKQLRILTAILLIFVTTFGMSIEASAASNTIEVELKRLALLNNDFTDEDHIYCSGINAMGVSRENENCLYTIKIDSKNEAAAIMYYFPDISNWKNYKKYDLYGVGHANGMTVDDSYIYICAYSKKNPVGHNNQVVRISRNYIDSLYNTNTRVLDDSLSDSYFKIMQPKIINPDETKRATEPYVEYTDSFSTITRDSTSGNFIIGKKIITGDKKLYYNGFTKAQIVDGEFVVSIDPKDMFLVENNIRYKYAAKQDICYASGYGLFIGRWYGTEDNDDTTSNPLVNKTYNVILWANIDGDRDYQYEYKGIKYDCYVPDKIKIDVTDYVSKEYNVKMYTFFEIESLGITQKGNLIANFNINYTDEYRNAYNNSNGVNPSRGGIYKIIRSDGKTFKLTDKV